MLEGGAATAVPSGRRAREFFVFIHRFLCSLYLKSRRGERPSWARGCALLGEEGAELLQVWAMAKGGPGRAGAGGCLLLGPPFGSATCSSTKI